MTEHEIRKVEVEAFVYSRETPTDEQLKKVQDFLEKKYNAAVAVIPKQDDSVRDGFRIEIGTSTYKWNLDRIFDWSAEGRAKQLKQSISEAIRGKQDVLPMIRQAIEDFEPVPKITLIFRYSMWSLSRRTRKSARCSPSATESRQSADLRTPSTARYCCSNAVSRA